MNNEKQKVFLRMMRQSLMTYDSLIKYGKKRMIDVPGSREAYKNVNEVLEALETLVRSDSTLVDAELHLLESDDTIEKTNELLKKNNEAIEELKNTKASKNNFKKG